MTAHISGHALARWQRRSGKDELAMRTAMANARPGRRCKHAKHHDTDEAEYWVSGRWVFVVADGIVLTVHANERGVVR